MRIITVGPSGQMFRSIAEANAHAVDGDVIRVQGGTYTNEFFQVMHNVTFQAVGARVVLACTANIGNGKGIVITGGTNAAPNVRFDGFDFVGAKVTDANGANGAGIRYQNGTLSLSNCHFQNCQNGILATPIYLGTGSVSIDTSEFNACGTNTGQTHNLYIGQVQNFSMSNCYSHSCKVGHLLKSRALNNTISNTRLFDLLSSASYEADFPMAGNVAMSGCVVQQGPNSQNQNIIAYAEETRAGLNPGRSFSVSSCTLVNDRGGVVGVWNNSPQAANINTNGIWGITPAQLCKGPFVTTGNTMLPARPTLDKSHPYADTFVTPTEEEDALMLAAGAELNEEADAVSL